MVNLSNLTYIMNSISVIVFIMLYAVRIYQQCNELVFNLFSITGDSNMENMGKILNQITKDIIKEFGKSFLISYVEMDLLFS